MQKSRGPWYLNLDRWDPRHDDWFLQALCLPYTVGGAITFHHQVVAEVNDNDLGMTLFLVQQEVSDASQSLGTLNSTF